MKNVFVVGLDEFHRPLFEALPAASCCNIHGLLDRFTLRSGVSFDMLVELAEKQLGRFARVDGITGFWDFPSSCLTPILCRAWNLPGPSLDAVVRCEHTYLSHTLLREVIPEHVPHCIPVDPFLSGGHERIPMRPPFWLKPVKSFGGWLGFRIDGPSDFEAALLETQAGIRAVAESFNAVLQRLHLPPELSHVDGFFAVAQEIVKGRECIAEGFVCAGEVELLGVVDVLPSDGELPPRRRYPSKLPHDVLRKVEEIVTRAVRTVGLEASAFSADFVWDEDSGRLWLLEIHPRVSQSNSELFAKVDGRSNHGMSLDLALGRKPEIVRRWGPYPVAAQLSLRHSGDAIVVAAPKQEMIYALEERYPGIRIKLLVHQGMRLSELGFQRPNGYELGWIYVGGSGEAEILSRFREVERALGLQLEPSSKGGP